MAVIASLSDEYKNTHEAHNAKLQRLKAEEENQRRTWQDTQKNNAVLSIDLPLSAIRQVNFLKILKFSKISYFLIIEISEIQILFLDADSSK